MTEARRAVRSAAAIPVRAKDPDVEALQRSVADLQRVSSPFSRGAETVVEWASAGSVTFKHRLGRVPFGWIVTRLKSQNNPVITERVAPTAVDLTLYSSADAIASVWVY